MHLLVLSAFRLHGCPGVPAGGGEVSMHLLVLSAFRLASSMSGVVSSPVSMHLLVLSAFRHYIKNDTQFAIGESQCTFWCSVLSDLHPRARRRRAVMGLNAPFGAQCFPTGKRLMTVMGINLCLNAPFGAQCFPTQWVCSRVGPRYRLNAPFGAQCFPTRIFALRSRD